ncbi:putative membrane protein [Geobacillus kaustophilus]|uniref:Putative membrane protein n=1 Tax=Geobacillus kaustophilus TaxID=1462 RepID=A0A0D8BTT4_GEOKU|nr:putative membrane protein [Geobacillus kaustophilus]
MIKRIKFILFTLFFSPSLFLINYYQSINMKRGEYPDHVFWILYLLVIVCLTVTCRSIRQILFSFLCMSTVSVGLGYWLIEKNESIRYLYNLGIPTTFIGLSLLVHVIPLFVCLFRSIR